MFDRAQQNKEGFYALVLFVMWPFLALISAFRNYKSPWAKNVLWAFTAYYGYTFAIGNESAGTDIVVYIEQYQAIHNISFTVSSAWNYFLSSGEVDVLRTLIAIILSRFTDAPSALTLVYGTIYGYFFSRNMWFVLEKLEGKLKYVTILLFLVFFFTVPIWDFNGFRMWTAAHAFVYGTFRYLHDEVRSGLLLCIFSIFIHFSFIVPVGALVAYRLAGAYMTIYFTFFVGTFFISEIDIEFFNSIVESYAPEILQERTQSYRGEDFVELSREDSRNDVNWYVSWHSRLIGWAIVGYIILLYTSFKNEIAASPKWLKVFCFVLLFYGVANLFSSLPSGGRFVSIARMLSLGMIVVFLQNYTFDTKIKIFSLIVAPAIALFIIVKVRIGLLSTSVSAILGNPLIAALFSGENISMNDLLRLIL